MPSAVVSFIAQRDVSDDDIHSWFNIESDDTVHFDNFISGMEGLGISYTEDEAHETFDHFGIEGYYMDFDTLKQVVIEDLNE